MDYLLGCPKCNDVILKSSGENTKIRGKMLVFKGGSAYSVCKKCDTEVKVPLLLDQDVVKSLKKSPKLYIK